VPFDAVAQPKGELGAVLVPGPTGRQVGDDRVEPALFCVLVEHDQVVEHRHQRPGGQRVGPVEHRHIRRAVPQMHPEDAPALLSRRCSSGEHQCHCRRGRDWFDGSDHVVPPRVAAGRTIGDLTCPQRKGVSFIGKAECEVAHTGSAERSS